MPALIFRSRGIDALNSKLGQQKNRIQSMRPQNLAAISLVRNWITDNFNRKGGLQPGGWPALKASTIRRKKGQGSILNRTGKLFGSFKITATTKRGRTFTSVKYATFHERGTKRMQMRKILPDEEKVINIIFPIYKKRVHVIINR